VVTRIGLHVLIALDLQKKVGSLKWEV